MKLVNHRFSKGRMMDPKVMSRRACNMCVPLLAFICWSGLVGCATGPEHSRSKKDEFPEARVERISLSPTEVKTAITPANAFNLSPSERKLCARRAAAGDIVAARKLARFYFMHHDGLKRTNRDNEKADYWQRVVARLEKSESTAVTPQDRKKRGAR
jgi:hypothetical protein